LERRTIVIPKVWRSEVPRLIVLALLAVASVVLSQLFPWSVLTAPIGSIGGYQVSLSLPLFWLLPLMGFFEVAFRIYNVRYLIDARGIEARIGILSLNQSITRIRFEDIRSIETHQTLLERILNVGLIEMGTAASAGVELVFRGVARPKEVQDMLQRERDVRVRLNRSDPAENIEQDSYIGNE